MEHLLVTGGCGFIGSNFIRYLLEEANFQGRVVNVDALTYAGNPDNLEDVAARFAGHYVFIQADICDRTTMAGVFADQGIDAVCHFAAESHVDRSIAAPDAFVQTNILGTFVLLACARERGERLKRFHHISTDEVFGSLGPEGAFDEESPYRPNSPYSASKAASDHLVRAYGKTYGLPVTLSNCSNNYGPYQFPEKLIPLMIQNAWEERPLPVYGDGRNVRDWLYVRDHCTAVWKVMTDGREGETYAVGGGAEMENIGLVTCLCDLLDEISPPKGVEHRRDLIRFVPDRPGHDRRYAIDASKIHAELGWHPEESFETGLRKTVLWYLENPTWVSRVRSGAYRDWIKRQYGTGF